MKTFRQIIEEYQQPSADVGPLMKANAWIGKQKLSKMAEHPDLNDGGERTLHVGVLKRSKWSRKPGHEQHVAILGHGLEDSKKAFKHGHDRGHSVYYDTGNGYKNSDDSLHITGHIHIHKDGSKTIHGYVPTDKPHTLHVFK